jgi:hypothetical protein
MPLFSRLDLIGVHNDHLFVVLCGARNGNVEVPAYFLKPKPEYTVRKMEKDKWK